MESKHTETPWKAWPTDGTLWIGGEKGYTVEFEDGDDAVKAEVAVNNHERLVEALREVCDQCEPFLGTTRGPDLKIEQARTLLAALESEKGGEL